MTDTEIVARALREAIGVACYCATWPYCDHQVDASTAAVVAALTEAGRLVPEGCVAIDAGRWERVHTVARDAHVWLNADGEESNDKNRAEDALSWSIDGLKPGDLDAELTP